MSGGGKLIVTAVVLEVESFSEDISKGDVVVDEMFGWLTGV